MAAFDWRWYGVAAFMLVAILAGIADWRRRHRRDLDRVGPIHWPTVQMLALIGALIFGMLALHG